MKGQCIDGEIVELKFTPLEFKTIIIRQLFIGNIVLKFTPLEFKTIINRIRAD